MFNRHRRQREVGKPRREVEQRAVADETVQTATEAWVKYGPNRRGAATSFGAECKW